MGRILLTIASLALLLSACQTAPPREQLDAPTQRERLTRLQHWQIEGKIALNYRGERSSAHFNWEQNGPHYAIFLSGPFGQGATWIRHNADGTSLENAELGQRYAQSPEALMASLVGWQVPISNIHFWIRGVPAPGLPVEYPDGPSHSAFDTLVQQGWTVWYDRPQRIRGWTLPGKIHAERDNIKIAIVAKVWHLPPSSDD